MNTTKLSSKGQVIIPKWLREANNWQAGLELIVVDTDDGILLKSKHPFAATTIEEVAGCLSYDGPPKTIEEMETAVQQGIAEEWHNSP
ncbi:MAG: AbrB/MazE/SpoVT family DNA-binding domain-containing protein [Chloroflexi bacterium]|nr:AbrB/MazE/SpoVT family DNA-binding domain-containing protein [Chloroflexota bacterium]